MKIFHQSSPYAPSNLLFLLDSFYFYYIYDIFCRWNLKNEVINRYMHNIMKNLKINPQVCINSCRSKHKSLCRIDHL